MLGETIKRFMKENGYTQKQLAIRSGCTESAISQYISNERTPNIRILQNIAIALGVTVNDIVTDIRIKTKSNLIEILKQVIITGKTYTEYIEAIADRLIEEGYAQKENKDD